MNARPHLILINPDVRHPNSLSLGYVAAYARSRGYGVDILDFCNDGASPAGLRRLLRERKPLLVGLGAYQQTMAQVIEVSRIVRAHSDARIILGGPQAWGMPEAALAELPEVDFLCRGEGELITASLLDALQEGDQVQGLPGISMRFPDGRTRTHPPPPAPTDLDEYPSPYLTGALRPPPGSQAPLLSSRGCVFNCTFCMTPMMSGRRVRFHSIERVVQEMSCLHDQGVDDIWFADPLFTVDRARVYDLFNRILALGRRFKIWCETRPELTDREMLELMREAGVTEISVGLESTSETALERMDKGQSLDGVTRLFRDAKAQGITVNLMHIVGAPGDTYSSILSTFDYIRGLDLLVDTYNRGNDFSVYFGTRDYAALNAGTLGAERVASGKPQPSYLAPGSQVRSKDLSGEDRARIAIRQRSEHNLAMALQATQELARQAGLSADQALRVPAQRIMELRNLLGPRIVKTQSGRYEPLHRVILDGRDGCTMGELRDRFGGILDELNYDGVLFVLGQEESLLCDEDFVAALHSRLTPKVLNAITIVFSFDMKCWRAHRRTLLRSLKRLPFLVPTRAAPDGPTGPAGALALLDVSNTEGISVADLDPIRRELADVGVDTCPFVGFDAAHTPSQWLRWTRGIPADALLGHPVFIATATRGRLAELRQLFEETEESTEIPALVMVDGEVLVGGARRLAGRLEKPTCGIHWTNNRPATDGEGHDGFSV